MEIMKHQISMKLSSVFRGLQTTALQTTAFAMVTNENLYLGAQRLEKLLYNTSKFFQPT